MPKRPARRRDPFPGLPNPTTIAEKMYDVTGDRRLSADNYPSAANLGVGFATAGLGNDEAYLMLKWTKFFQDQMLLAQIGHYDPARNKWRFIPEYVGKSQSGPLARYYAGRLAIAARGYAENKRVPEGGVVIDSHHPHTRTVRQDMARQLEGVDTKTLLHRAALLDAVQFQDGEGVPGSAIADGYTMTYAAYGKVVRLVEQQEPAGPGDTITSLVREDTHQRNLLLVYRGLLVGHPDRPDKTVRTNASVTIAQRMPGTDWAPTGIMTGEEWQTLRPLGGILDLAQVQHPDFSPYYAAVAHNAPLGNEMRP